MKPNFIIIIIVLLNTIGKAEAQKISKFEIHLDTKYAVDTVCLDILSEFTGGGTHSLKVDESLVDISADGIFKFALPPKSEPFYITIRSPDTEDRIPMTWETHTLFQYLVIPGDSVVIKFDENTKQVSFKGDGYLKYLWRYNADKMIQELKKKYYYPKIKAKEKIAAEDLILSRTLLSLDSLKANITPEEYNLLRADIIGLQMGSVALNLAFLNFFWIPSSPHYSDRVEAEQYARAYEQRYLKGFDDTSSYLVNSSLWATFLFHRAWAQKSYERFKGRPILGTSFEYLKKYPSGSIRDKALIESLLSAMSAGRLTDSLLFATREHIVTEKYLKLADGLFEKLMLGRTVDTNFTFTDKNNKPVKISDFQGKFVIVDMWFTGCIPCIQVATQLPRIEKELADIKDLLFVSLSIDRNRQDWLKSINPLKKRDSNISYTHYTTETTKYLYTSDTGDNNSFIRTYNPAGSYPRMLLIDSKGRVLSRTLTNPTDVNSAQKFIKEIRSAIENKNQQDKDAQ